MPTPGTVVVEMLPEAARVGAIHLPDRVAGRLRPDVGRVLAAGRGVDLAPGDLVAVRPYGGRWIEGFDFGYQTANQVRLYGRVTPFHGEIERVPWFDSIPLVMNSETMKLSPTGRHVLLRRDPLVVREGTLFLSDAACYRPGTATLEAMGPGCDLGSAQVGDRVLYDPRAELDFSLGGDSDLCLVTDAAIDLLLPPLKETT